MKTKLFMAYWQAIALIGLIVMASCSTTPSRPTGGTAMATTAVTSPLSTGRPTQATLTSRGPWVQFVNKQLVYRQDTQGNHVPDFSYVGYGGGTQPIPQVPVQITLSPQANSDDTARIQQAIDTISQRSPNAQGLRGAVLLQAGQYHIGGSLNIQASGVVLRGKGSGFGGTVLVAQGSPHTLVNMAGTGKWVKDGTNHHIIDRYVPVGAFSFHVDSTTDLHVGDRIIIQRPTTATWIHALGMDQIPPRNDGHAIKQWVPGTGLEFDRIITAINNHQITIDAPLTNALEQQYTHAIIWRYTFPGRISQVGIENLSSDGTAFTKDPGYLAKESFFQATFAQVSAVENGWIQNVVFQHYGQGINIDRTAKWVTATDIDANMEVPKISDPPEAFSIVGQQILISNCQVTGNYIHAWTTMSGTAGPNVFTHCTATGDIKVDAGPHERWGTGTLYDDLSMPNGNFAVQDRGNLGSGHGWAGANNMLWNCVARSYLVQSPPTAQNWVIGCTGKINTSPLFPGPQGYIDSPDQQVQPTSLYAEQLAERLHTPNR